MRFEREKNGGENVSVSISVDVIFSLDVQILYADAEALRQNISSVFNTYFHAMNNTLYNNGCQSLEIHFTPWNE